MSARRRAPGQAPGWADLFRAAPVGLAIAAGPEDRYVFVNEEFCRIAGRPASEFLGQSVAAASVGRSESGEFGQAAAKIRRDRVGLTREGVAVTFPSPSGEERRLHLDIRLEPLLDERGDVGGLLVVLVDVTERVAAQQRAASLERLQSAVLQQMSNAVVIVDREGRLVLLNPAARAMGGPGDTSAYRVADLARVLQVRTPDGRPLDPERSPLRRALGGETVPPADYVMRRPTDGSDVWVSYGAAPLRDESGAITGAFGVLADRTTEHALRDAIGASEHRLRRVYEAVACGLLVRDASGVIVFANHEAARIFGIPAAKLVGTAQAFGIERFTESGERMAEDGLPFRIALREGRAVRDQLSRIVRQDGSEVWVRVDAAPIPDDDGAVEYVVTSFVDTTQRKLAEDRLALRARQQAAIADLGRLALGADDLAALFAETVRAVNGLLGAETCRVIEHDPERHRLAVRAGQRLTPGDAAEWLPDDPGASQAGYTMAVGRDVLANDLATERRFRVYQPILEQGYRATATVVIPGHDRPFGLIAALSREGAFSEEDLTFLRTVANTLGEAIDRLAALQRVRRNEERLRTVVDNLPLDLMVYDAAGRVTLTTGRRGKGRLQTPPAVGESVYDVNRHNPGGLNRIVRALRGEEVREEVQTGDTVIDMRHQPVLGPDGTVTEVVGLALDVTERAAAQAELARKEAFIRTIFDSVDTDIAVLDQRGVIVDANQHWLAHAHRGEPDVKNAIVGDDYLTFLRDSPADGDREMAAGIAAVLDGRRASLALEFPVQRTGERRWYQLSVEPMRSDVRGVVIAHRDITERKRIEEALEHQALHDSVTGLPNRTLLRDRLRQAILAGRRRRVLVGLLFIDLDRFKDLNDTFGHQAGDGVLREVGERFARAVRGSDTVARLGGDEFAVLVPQAADAEEVLQVARRVLASLEAPFAVEGERAFIEASIGIVLCPEHGEDVQTLMRRADVAMYSAKRSGSGLQLYEPDKDLHSPSAIGLAGDLRHAIERGELVFHYQPMVDLRSGRCIGVEALARWQHPSRGLLAPAQFIPLAEENGSIRQIGLWSLQEALRVIGAGLAMPVIAVNLSMRNLRGSDLAPTVAELLARTRADPLRLKIEITETAMMADAEHALAVLGELRRMGIGLSIDDFGTGYSSLAYLQRLPVDDIKVDRSFVLHMLTNPSDEAIVRSTIELAHNLGLRAIAEGVEDQSTLERLSELGCDGAQGFHLGRPMSADELAGWLRTSPWGSGG